MSNDEKIENLQRQINVLAQTIGSSVRELKELQEQLDELRGHAKSMGQPFRGVSNQVPTSPAQFSNEGLENFIGLRFMHIVGIIVLVIGLSIGVKYAIDKEFISEAMRIILAYGASLALFLFSLRLRKNYLLFSAILFSGSMASAYFTTYAAFVYYQFFPAGFAFGIMTALTIYTVVAAIGYNIQEIAVLGMVGAYGIPFLVSANADRVDLFFSYILIINLGVAFISFRRSWRIMQYLALLITWLLFAGWAFLNYTSKLQEVAVIFMLAYYFLFSLSALSPAISNKRGLLPGEVQQVLINNAALYLAAVLVFGNGGFELNLPATTGIVSIFFMIVAIASTIFLPGELLLQRMLAWLTIVLVVFYAGLQWDGLPVTMIWVGIAIALFAWGAYNKRSWPRLASILLMGFTLIKLVLYDSQSFTTIQKIIAFIMIGVLLLLFSFYYQKFNLSKNKSLRK